MICSLVTHFGERPERIAHGLSFLVSNLSDSLSSLIKKEGMRKSLVKKRRKKTYQKIWFYNFSQLFLSKSISRSVDMSDLSDALTVAHLSWAIWANRSQSLIWFERSEQMSEFPALIFIHEWIPIPKYTKCGFREPLPLGNNVFLRELLSSNAC